MSFNWEDYLALAKKLQDPHNIDPALDEACKRSAISRAYYSAFQLSLPLAEQKCSFIRKVGNESGQNHSLLSKWLKMFADNDFKRLGNLLGSLRYRRRECDYEPAVTSLDRHLITSMKEADESLEIIKRRS